MVIKMAKAPTNKELAESILNGIEFEGKTLLEWARFIFEDDFGEVVRCSECQHRHNPMRCALWYGTLGDNEYFLEHGDKFYCAFGERRSENES